MSHWQSLRFAPTPGTPLCASADIAEGSVREFRFGGDSPFAFRLFVTHSNGDFIAFRNSCPHFDVPLNHTPEELLADDGAHYLCTTHFAKFDRLTGLCIYGPCEGEYLDRIPIVLVNGEILIAESGE